MNRRTVVTAVLLAAATAALYLPRLQDAPIYLVPDEVFSALTVHSVASTGRDPHGTFLPLYFQMDLLKRGSPMWFQPLLIYAMTGAVKVRSFSEAALRLPMALAGIVNVVLTYFAGRLLFERERFAIIAAVLLAFTPTHLMYSRVAMDFQAPLPFVLGWLVCVLAYVKGGDARLLPGAGFILGIGVYSYVAAAAFMPLYALLTCVVLLMRRDPVRRYVLLAIGFIVPASLSVAFLIAHPAMLRDVAVHYQPDGSVQAGSAAGAMASVFSPGRLIDVVGQYASFWNPWFLFVDGPHRYSEAWLIGVFLLPTAALLLIGIAWLVRHPDRRVTLLLLAGLVTAPLPASFVDQPEAIRRALELLPFAVLIAAVGLEGMKTSRSTMARWIAFVAFWVVLLALAIAAHDHVPHAQAFVRAATVPLGLAALMVVFHGFPLERLGARDAVVAAVIAWLTVQVAYVLGRAPLVDLALAVVLAAALTTGGSSDSPMRRAIAMVLLVLVASELLFQYVDYFPSRVGPVPASAALLLIRGGVTALVLAVAIAAAVWTQRVATSAGRDIVVTSALALAAAVQIAYFYVDLWVDPRLRVVCVGVVTVLLFTTAALASAPPASSPADRLGDLTAVGVLVVVCLQFAYFYVDYFTKFQARGSGTNVGNVRLGLEAAIDLTQNRDVPAIYLARVRNESPGLGKAYADFYLLKHDRPDLIARTEEGDTYTGFELDRLMKMPRGSLIIVSPNGRNDPVIEQLVARGDLKKHAHLSAPDGTPLFWILERL